VKLGFSPSGSVIRFGTIGVTIDLGLELALKLAAWLDAKEMQFFTYSWASVIGRLPFALEKDEGSWARAGSKPEAHWRRCSTSRRKLSTCLFPGKD